MYTENQTQPAPNIRVSEYETIGNTHSNSRRIVNRVNTQQLGRLRNQTRYLAAARYQASIESPCILAIVGISGLAVLVFIISNVFIGISLQRRVTNSNSPGMSIYDIENATFSSVCMAVLPQVASNYADCSLSTTKLDRVRMTIAITEAGSLGPHVVRHISKMMDSATLSVASIRLKKVSCIRAPENTALCAVSVQVEANRFIYLIKVDISNLTPVEDSGRLLAIPEFRPTHLFPDRPTLFNFGNDTYISLLSIDYRTDAVNHAYLWDIKRSIRVEIRLPAFISKNWAHFATTWVPWVTQKEGLGEKLRFMFSLLPLQTVTCSFVSSDILALSLRRREQFPQPDRYLQCTLESTTAPVLSRPLLIEHPRENFLIKDSSLFLQIRDGYYLGYIQIFSDSVSKVRKFDLSGHLIVINEKSRGVVAFTSSLFPFFPNQPQVRVIKEDDRKENQQKKINRTVPSTGGFLLFGGSGSHHGSTLRIIGIEPAIDLAITRDQVYEDACRTVTRSRTDLLELSGLSMCRSRAHVAPPVVKDFE